VKNAFFGTTAGFASEIDPTPFSAHNFDLAAYSSLQSDCNRGDGVYNLDTPVELILAHQSQSHSPNNSSVEQAPFQSTRLPSEKWRQLTSSARTAWLALDDKTKRIILGNSASSGNNINAVPSVEDSLRSANLHDISVYDFLKLQHNFSPPMQSHGEQPDTRVIAPSPPPAPNPTSTINANTHEQDEEGNFDISQALDMRRILSTQLNSCRP